MLSKATEALHLTAEEHKAVADHIRVVNLLITDAFEYQDKELERVKALKLEREREIAELKKKIKG